ncbi:MAG: Tfx family DNA-binding protein [Methanocalculaceae archaeon]|jgi:Tfx family DNA-binding protein|nr:Tfx family DNA-binding protein [Methanocalculaceae archaeon]
MKDTLLTNRQKEVIRYRKQGMTQQQIADHLGTSKANICTIVKSATRNIQRAKETLEYLYTLDSANLCVLAAGTDLLETPHLIYQAAATLDIKIRYDSISLINRLSTYMPEKIKGRHIKEDIHVYLNTDGDLSFG